MELTIFEELAVLKSADEVPLPDRVITDDDAVIDGADDIRFIMGRGVYDSPRFFAGVVVCNRPGSNPIERCSIIGTRVPIKCDSPNPPSFV